MSNFLTTMGAAEVLKVHRRTIWRWIQQGKLTPSAYANGKALFDPNYIKAVAERDKPQEAA